MLIQSDSFSRFCNKKNLLSVNLMFRAWPIHFTKGGRHVFPLPIWIAGWHPFLVCVEPYGQKHQDTVPRMRIATVHKILRAKPPMGQIPFPGGIPNELQLINMWWKWQNMSSLRNCLWVLHSYKNARRKAGFLPGFQTCLVRHFSNRMPKRKLLLYLWENQRLIMGESW